MARQCLAEMPKTPRIQPTHRSPHRVEILVFPQAQLLDVAGPLQVLATANELATEAGLPPPYQPHVIARHGGPITTSAGLMLLTEPLPSMRHSVNTMLVAGGHGVYTAAKDRQLVRWIARRAGQAVRVASVCPGAFLLAEPAC